MVGWKVRGEEKKGGRRERRHKKRYHNNIKNDINISEQFSTDTYFIDPNEIRGKVDLTGTWTQDVATLGIAARGANDSANLLQQEQQ